MPDGRLAAVVQRLQTLARAEQGGELTDAQLVQRFAAGRDEEAFALLVRRHGPLVLAVCRRVLGHEQDAEDAFQATFLILARRASSVRARVAVGSWLYRVAVRVALSAKGRPRPLPLGPEALPGREGNDPADEAARRELGPVIDEELRRLPEKYRVPVVLCWLQGKTHEAAAAELGWPRGTVAGRLARARDLLRARLTRRGVALSAGALAAGLAEAGQAAVPEGLARATAEGAARFAAARGGPGVSVHAIELARGALHAMFLTRIKVAGAVLLLLSLLAGAGSLALGGRAAAPAAPQGRPPAAKPSAPAAQDGLSITVRPLKAVFAANESPVFEVTLKNITDKELTLYHTPSWAYPFRRFLIEEVKTGRLQNGGMFVPDALALVDRKLAPGESVTTKQELADLFVVPAEGERLRDLVRFRPGKHRVKATIELRANPRGKGLYWSGALTSAWAEFEVAAPAGKGDKAAPPKDDREAILGTWRVVDAELDGRDAGEGPFEDQTRWIITREKIVLKGLRGGGTWTYKLDPSRTPRELDLRSSPKGPLMPSIYQLSGDRLKVCLPGTDGVRPKALSSRPSRPGLILYTLRREPPKAEKPAKKGGPPAKPSEYISASVRTPSSWYLYIQPDGGAQIGYGSHFPDSAHMPAGTFDLDRLAEEVKKRTVPKGTLSDSYTVGLFKKGDRTASSVYPVDARFVAGLFATARQSAQPVSADRLESLWSLRPPTPFSVGPWRPRPRELRQADAPFVVALSPNGKFAATGYRPRLWDTAIPRDLGALVKPEPPPPPGQMLADPPEFGHFRGPPRHEPVRAVAFSADGKTLATGGADGSIKLWEVKTRLERRALNWFVGGPGRDPNRFLGLRPRKVGWRGGGVFDVPVRSLAFRPDGKVLAAAIDNFVCLWDPASGKTLAILAGHLTSVTCVAFSPDGQTLATGGEDRSVRLWDAATGKELHRFHRHQYGVLSVAFSPDGRLLASAGKDKTAQLWDLRTRELVWTFRGHKGEVRAALFTPDGKYLLTGSADRTVRVWDVAREEQYTLLGSTEAVTALSLSGDGALLAVADQKTVRLWEANRGGPGQP
jgi:RNA polymerase sigma factor (sigma-70 family)